MISSRKVIRLITPDHAYFQVPADEAYDKITDTATLGSGHVGAREDVRRPTPPVDRERVRGSRDATQERAKGCDVPRTVACKRGCEVPRMVACERGCEVPRTSRSACRSRSCSSLLRAFASVGRATKNLRGTDLELRTTASQE